MPASRRQRRSPRSMTSTGAFGGPIKRIAVGYFVNARTQGSTTTVASIYYNQNAGDATKWTYVPDVSQPAYTDRTWENVSGRLTWQATSRNKIGVFWDHQWICRKCTGMTQGLTDPARVTPEAIGVQSHVPLRVTDRPGRRPHEPAAAGRRLRRHGSKAATPNGFRTRHAISFASSSNARTAAPRTAIFLA